MWSGEHILTYKGHPVGVYMVLRSWQFVRLTVKVWTRAGHNFLQFDHSSFLWTIYTATHYMEANQQNWARKWVASPGSLHYWKPSQLVKSYKCRVLVDCRSIKLPTVGWYTRKYFILNPAIKNLKSWLRNLACGDLTGSNGVERLV